MRDTREIFEKLAWPIFSGIFDASSKTFPATGDGLVRELQVLHADNPKNHGAYYGFNFFGTILSLSVSNLMCVFFFHNKCNCFLVVCYVWKGMGWGGWRDVVHDVTYGFVCLWSQLELKSESELGGWKCIISTLTLLTFYASPKSWNVKPSYHGGSSTPPSMFPLLLMSNLIFVAWLSLTHIWDQSVTLLIVLCFLMGTSLFGVSAHL